MIASKWPLIGMFAIVTFAGWNRPARAMPCRFPVCPGEVGKEGPPTRNTPPPPACPSQDGADCPHSCPHATAGPCPAATLVTYVQIDKVDKSDPGATCDGHGRCTDPRATCDVRGENCRVKLVGDLYVPAGAKRAPAIIYNHGSVSPGCDTCDHTPGQPCAIAQYFVSQGYVVFMPHRRGYPPSTGKNQISSLEDESRDVVDAFKYLERHQSAAVDSKKIALLGHSLGGIASIYANEQDFGQVAAVSISGGSESWCGNDKLHARLKQAVNDAKTPIYFLEPKDDVSTAPTIELSHEMGLAGKRFQAAIFGPVANDDDLAPIHCGAQAHVCFTKDKFQVGRWAPSVLEYLQRFGVK
jgi:dienelactone hydrolase